MYLVVSEIREHFPFLNVWLPNCIIMVSFGEIIRSITRKIIYAVIRRSFLLSLGSGPENWLRFGNWAWDGHFLLEIFSQPPSYLAFGFL